MKKIILLCCVGLLCCTLTAQPNYTPTPANLKAREWFNEARFGMFIHWGISSYLGDGEWVMEIQKITANDYAKLIEFFNPDEFDAAQWVSTAKKAGMKYITFTTRHHDSFSNWDTKQSDWKITRTRFKRDVLKELAEECKKQDIKLFCYYSTLDWFRSDYQYETGGTGKGSGRTEKGDWSSYINFMKAQLTEILTEYGPIAGIWFDGHWDQAKKLENGEMEDQVNWHYDEIYSLIHTLQPSCLVGNNHHTDPIPGEDFQMFERDLPGENIGGFNAGAKVSQLPLETCETMNKTWGYNFRDNNVKTNKQLVDLLTRAAGYGANLLLNVGPMPNGKIQPEFVERLGDMGDFMNKYGFTIYGSEAGFIKPQPWGAITQKGNTYYIHILKKEGESLELTFPKKIKSAVWVNSPEKLVWKQDKKTKKVNFSLNASTTDYSAIMEVIVTDK